MSFLTVPTELECLFGRPGRVWTNDERWQVAAWLNGPAQRARLLRYAALQIACTCSTTTFSDAEDTWSKFCVDRLNKVIRHYDPALSPFVPFLLLAFKRTCWREGKRLRFQLEQIGLARTGDPSPALGPIARDNPEQAIARQQTSQRLQECVAALPAEYRTLIVQHYFAEKQLREIADALGITEGAAKVRLYRARRKLEAAFRHSPVTAL